MKLAVFALPLASAFVLPQLVLQDIESVYQSALSVLNAPAALPGTPYESLPPVDSKALQELITFEELNASAHTLYDIANASTVLYGHPTRVVGSPGHWRTLNWITDQIANMSEYYTYYSQEFEMTEGKVLNYSLNVDFKKIDSAKAFKMSPSVGAWGSDVFVVPNYGCEDEDYIALANSTSLYYPGIVALVKRGTCSYGNKSSLAGKFGAKAVLVYDPDSPDVIDGATLGVPTNTTVGALAIPRSTALYILAKKSAGLPVNISMFIASYVAKIKARNIIAETIHGDKDNVVALGAHSDSVEAGPGINDDGSGTISLLAVAKALTNFQVTNAVRFAWWAGEEEGLLGSNFYANSLTPEENQKIRLFMDYDMMASPNYQYFVYNGSNEVNPVGSSELRDLYIDYYESKGLPYELTPFDGRSDYVGFIENGIPGGGILTGDDDINPDNGEPCDWCYHQLCDDVGNLDFDAFLVNTQLIGHSVATYASDLSGFPERELVDSKSASPAPYLRRGGYYVM